MRKILTALSIAIASPAFAQAGGVQSDLVVAGQLDLSSTDNTWTLPVGNGQGVGCFDVSGITGSGATIVTERQVGSLWTASNMLVTGTAGAFSTSLTADATYCVNTVARRSVRVRVLVAGTGTAALNAVIAANSSLVQLVSPLPPGTNALGSVSVSNLPATQPVSGTVAATQSGTWTVGLNGALPPGTNALGSVSVSNFPTTQTVSGSIGLTGSLPAFATTPTFNCGTGCYQATQPVSGTVSVSNFPSTAAPANDPTGQVAVSTSATLVVAARSGRVKVVLSPTTSVAYFTGNSASLTTANGLAVLPGGSVTLYTANAVYAIGAAAFTISYKEYY